MAKKTRKVLPLIGAILCVLRVVIFQRLIPANSGLHQREKVPLQKAELFVLVLSSRFSVSFKEQTKVF
jgi:hypothetical protein